jgi:hypothetical protein
VDATSADKAASPELKRRIGRCAQMREASKKPTQALAATPHLFGEIRQTDQPYILIPLHTSENRRVYSDRVF